MLIAGEIVPLSGRGFVGEFFPSVYGQYVCVTSKQKAVCVLASFRGEGAYTFASIIVSMSFNSPSATWMTSSIRPPPIWFSMSNILSLPS